MIYSYYFSLAESLRYMVVLFILLFFDVVLTNIVARAAGVNYHFVEALPWVKWIYRKGGFTVALFIHFFFNVLLFVGVIFLPVRAVYLLFFIGLFFLRDWSVGYKAYIYARGLLR